MTDTAPPIDAPPTTRRGRLQRRLRRQSRTAGRDTAVAMALTALVVGVVHGGGLLEGEPAAAAEMTGDATFRAVMVGDVMFGRHVERAAERHGHDWLLQEMRPVFAGADYVTGNLEQVITPDPDALPDADKLIHLASDERAAQALADAGFTTMALANNHLMDHGIPGLRDTIAALDEVGLSHVGAGASLQDAIEIDYQEHGELTVATLAFSDAYVVGFVALAFQGGVLSAEQDRASRLIREASANADLVITHFHWGTEYGFAANRDQRELAEMAAASGADIVIGHHPHVLQRVERIGDTLVFYSLGNFVFDQGWSRTRESAVARYQLRSDGRARVELLPIEIREGAPRLLSGPLAEYRRARIFQRLGGGEGLAWRREAGMLITEVDHGRVVATEGDVEATS
ncbi:CapA family protein [Egicoccus sp. AB-alg6-2]|uniref:CapA family protein n=1 Tax=Egicoccus sp. AB-alg6-2 TaxID=3242692 RepID=UPI00359DAFAD